MATLFALSIGFASVCAAAAFLIARRYGDA
jgi:hypothetical protein